VATSPIWAAAIAPLAKEFAGATAAAAALVPAVVPVPVPALADADADGLADAGADGLAVEPSADWLMFVLCDPPETAMTAPRATPNATGMAIGMAIFIARLLLCLRNLIHLHVRCDAPG